MATIEVSIASRRYSVACRDGEEEHLRSAAAIVDEKAKQAASALGSLPEARQLLFASLLLADELKDRPASGAAPAADAARQTDDVLASALDRLADRMEMLATRLETGQANP